MEVEVEVEEDSIITITITITIIFYMLQKQRTNRQLFLSQGVIGIVSVRAISPLNIF